MVSHMQRVRVDSEYGVGDIIKFNYSVGRQGDRVHYSKIIKVKARIEEDQVFVSYVTECGKHIEHKAITSLEKKAEQGPNP